MKIIPLFYSIRDHAEKNPTKPAVKVVGEDKSYSYADLTERIANAAAGLKKLDLSPGGFVAVDSDHPYDHLVSIIGVMAAGGVPVILPLGHAQARSTIIDDAQPQWIITLGNSAVEAKEITLGSIENNGCESPSRLTHVCYGEDIAMVYYTSGTTSGIRKGVLQNHRALEATARYLIDLMEITPDIIEFIASPTDNAFWFGRCRVVLRVGGTIVLNPLSFNPLRILGSINSHHCNAISGDTPVFVMLMDFAEQKVVEIGPQIRWCKIASQAMAADRKRLLKTYMPNARMVMNYGLTEAMRCAILSITIESEKLDSVGLPCPGVSIKIVDDSGKEVADDESGEIIVSGDNLASGYLNKKHLWDERCRDGWYATGDLGSLDTDGYLYIRGRKDEAINVGGKIVSPFEVEGYLKPYLPNTPFFVCGVEDPDNILGDVSVLCVEGTWAEEKPWKDLRFDILKTIPKAFVPRLAFEVSSIPRTTNGKPQLSYLREQIESGKYSAL